mmetsp:Transcript_10177/g.18330  ORF Transcript_10177/g.18330 Transcript_10177/m.18330 type:complete len:115 (-) Transcript_10177:238-582(-)
MPPVETVTVTFSSASVAGFSSSWISRSHEVYMNTRPLEEAGPPTNPQAQPVSSALVKLESALKVKGLLYFSTPPAESTLSPICGLGFGGASSSAPPNWKAVPLAPINLKFLSID